MIIDSIDIQFPYLGWNAYQGLSIVYLNFAFFNFFVPSLLSVMSSKSSLILGNLVQMICFSIFIYPIEYTFIIVSAMIGICQSILWVSNGKFLIENSTHTTIDRNVSIFWAIHQIGSMLGSIYVYMEFNGVDEIDANKRIKTYIILLSFLLISAILLLFLKKTSTSKKEDDSLSKSPIDAFKSCFSLLKTKEIALLIIPFLYTGLQQSFYMGIYPAVLANSSIFGDDTVKLIGIFGVYIATGEIIGSIILNWLGKRIFKENRSMIYFIGFLFNLITYTLVFLSHPRDSTYRKSYDESIFFTVFNIQPKYVNWSILKSIIF